MRKATVSNLAAKLRKKKTRQQELLTRRFMRRINRLKLSVCNMPISIEHSLRCTLYMIQDNLQAFNTVQKMFSESTVFQKLIEGLTEYASEQLLDQVFLLLKY